MLEFKCCLGSRRREHKQSGPVKSRIINSPSVSQGWSSGGLLDRMACPLRRESWIPTILRDYAVFHSILPNSMRSSYSTARLLPSRHTSLLINYAFFNSKFLSYPSQTPVVKYQD